MAAPFLQSHIRYRKLQSPAFNPASKQNVKAPAPCGNSAFYVLFLAFVNKLLSLQLEIQQVMANTNEQIEMIELFLDANGKECKKEDAVKVYARLIDRDGKYIHAELIPL